MNNVCISRICCIQHRAPVSLNSSSKCIVFRTFSTCALAWVPHTAPHITRSPLSLVMATQKTTPFDAPQRSDEWFALRKNKLTTSTFSTALGFWKGTRRSELWHEKVFSPEPQFGEASRRAMDWGVLNESVAIEKYKSITGREVGSLSFAIHSQKQLDWVGASPDGVLGCFPEGGILEVKCPFNKGKPELGLPWSTVPFYYMPQVQGQMEIMDRDWVDLYCWTPNGSTIFRVNRDRDYWDLIHGILREFWWENVVPAKEALLLEREDDCGLYKPESTHKKTGLAISKSINLAAVSKLLCREIAGHVEFYR